jgi:hypothetical protein
MMRPSFVPLTLAMDLHILRSTKCRWLLQHARVVELADGIASGVVEIWDEQKNLLAMGTQLRVCQPLQRSSAQGADRGRIKGVGSDC